MARLEERDLRSLERRSLYTIFKPLDEDERISRKLVAEDELMPTSAGKLAVWGFLRRARRRRRPNGSEYWVPAMFMFVRRFG
jgi:hypothetical protein